MSCLPEQDPFLCRRFIQGISRIEIGLANDLINNKEFISDYEFFEDPIVTWLVNWDYTNWDEAEYSLVEENPDSWRQEIPTIKITTTHGVDAEIFRRWYRQIQNHELVVRVTDNYGYEHTHLGMQILYENKVNDTTTAYVFTISPKKMLKDDSYKVTCSLKINFAEIISEQINCLLKINFAEVSSVQTNCTLKISFAEVSEVKPTNLTAIHFTDGQEGKDNSTPINFTDGEENKISTTPISHTDSTI